MGRIFFFHFWCFFWWKFLEISRFLVGWLILGDLSDSSSRSITLALQYQFWSFKVRFSSQIEGSTNPVLTPIGKNRFISGFYPKCLIYYIYARQLNCKPSRYSCSLYHLSIYLLPKRAYMSANLNNNLMYTHNHIYKYTVLPLWSLLRKRIRRPIRRHLWSRLWIQWRVMMLECCQLLWPRSVGAG